MFQLIPETAIPSVWGQDQVQSSWRWAGGPWAPLRRAREELCGERKVDACRRSSGRMQDGDMIGRMQATVECLTGPKPLSTYHGPQGSPGRQPTQQLIPDARNSRAEPRQPLPSSAAGLEAALPVLARERAGGEGGARGRGEASGGRAAEGARRRRRHQLGRQAAAGGEGGAGRGRGGGGGGRVGG